jgi:hypothetical protein
VCRGGKADQEAHPVEESRDIEIVKLRFLLKVAG